MGISNNVRTLQCGELPFKNDLEIILQLINRQKVVQIYVKF